MRLKTKERETAWLKSKKLSPLLGDIFQNEYDLDVDMITEELAIAQGIVDRVQAHITDLHKLYDETLIGTLEAGCDHTWTEATDMPMVYCTKCSKPHPTAYFLTDLDLPRNRFCGDPVDFTATNEFKAKP